MTSHKFTNRLVHESSPYLLQHANNPVDWHPWNQETLEKARSLDKMILVSVGYSACHWCHVMEKESFEDEAVAKVMNENFVCIKVDREERPDVDQVYMEAVQMITGGGGWPLNCFALPDGRPFFGGTYFRKQQWTDLLENISLLYKTRKNDLLEQAKDLTSGLNREIIESVETGSEGFSNEIPNGMVASLQNHFDPENGGSAGAPKFPMPVLLNFLLHYNYEHKNAVVQDHIELSLKKMALGGIFDHLGGGFARYSTDAKWKVPHFEKMLYDNAQLVSLYADACLTSKDPVYKETIEKTLRFIHDEMTHPEGGFFAALDADSEGEEGKYYVWKSAEIKNLLGTKANLFNQYYQVDGEGLWENGNNILIKRSSYAEMAESLKIDKKSFQKHIRVSEKILLSEREKRVRPGLDDKVIASWNGLMLRGYLDAFRALGDEKYLKRALKNHAFIEKHLKRDDGGLWHVWKDGKANINGFCEDYAFVIDAYISLYQATFDEKILHSAELLLQYTLKHFFDEADALFYFTSGLDPSLVARKKEIQDTVTPSSNSVMAQNLFVLGELLQNQEYIGLSAKMAQRMQNEISRYPGAYSNWGKLWLLHSRPFYTIVVAGKEYRERLAEMSVQYLPDALFAGAAEHSSMEIFRNRFVDGKTLIYVCSGNECKYPVEDPAEAIQMIKKDSNQ
jgi:hypothetical protein